MIEIPEHHVKTITQFIHLRAHCPSAIITSNGKVLISKEDADRVNEEELSACISGYKNNA